MHAAWRLEDSRSCAPFLWRPRLSPDLHGYQQHATLLTIVIGVPEVPIRKAALPEQKVSSHCSGGSLC